MRFNIFSEIKKEIDDFNTGGTWITGRPKNDNNYSNIKRGERGGYWFSQRDTIESIDMASASKFKKGIWDEEGQRKTYMNIVNFYRDVMKMKINIDVKDYVLQPTSVDFTWPVILMDRKFKEWAEDESYDDLLDEFSHDLSTYGSTVSKKTRDCGDRVPLRTLRNTQTAKTLYGAAINGGYVHIENEFHYNRMKEYPSWDLTGLGKNKQYCVIERYALVPASFLKNWKTAPIIESKEDEDMVLAQVIVIPEERSKNSPFPGKILFAEKLDEKSWPLEECHTEQRDGRWLGYGEIEKQLENQISRNLTVNLRRRGILWATKRIYQSSDDEVQRNLVMEVKDGEVIRIKPNGNVTQVNTQSQHLADFSQDESSWKENSQQNAFAFEVATGESMPGGTPFRLGVVLSQAVASHFKLVRKTYSNFLKRSFFDQLIPIFKSEYSDEHTVQIPMGATDIDNLKEAMAVYHVNIKMFNAVHAGEQFDMQSARQEVDQEMARSPYLFISVPAEFYDNANAYMHLNLVDDITAEMTTLTTLYQTMASKGDPRAEGVLRQIFALQGRSYDLIAGPAQQSAPAQPAGAGPSMPMPQAGAAMTQ